MFALHWICALTLALVSCLSSQPVKRDDNGLMTHINELKEEITDNPNCSDEIKLYSFEIREDCMSSAVNCAIIELNVFKTETECKHLQEAIGDLAHAMKQTQWKIPKTDNSHSNCTCEMHPETGVETFVDSIKGLVQYLNSNY